MSLPGLVQPNLKKAAFRSSTRVGRLDDAPPPRWGAVPPAKYRSKYPALVKMEKRGLRNAFGNGEAGHSLPLVARRSIEVFPGVQSFDPTFLKYLRELSETLTKEIPVMLDDDKFTPNGVHTGFASLKCVANFGMNPMSYTPVDNREYRRELGLTPGYNPRQAAIVKELWRIAMEEIDITRINVPKLSQGGARRFTFDVQWKLAFAEWLMEPVRFEKVLDAIARDDWEVLANEYEILFITYIQKRGQVDAVGKERTVFDLEYALSGGVKGRSFPADKAVAIDGVQYPDFSAVRLRVIHAGPWAVNVFLQHIFTPVLRSLFRRFPKTFHVNTFSQIESTLEGWYVVGSDVSDYDRSMSHDAIDIPHEVMAEFWDPRLVHASKKLFYSPYYAKPLSVDGDRAEWVGDPTETGAAGQVFAGNRSGHGGTTVFAKLNKVADSLMVIDRFFPVLGRVREMLQWRLHIALINNGDDEEACFKDPGDRETYIKHRTDLKAGHYKVEIEDGHGFSGAVLERKGPTSYKCHARVLTSLTKSWVPERAIGGKHRPFWPIGFLDRGDNLTASSVGRAVWDIQRRTYERILAPKFGGYHDILRDAVAALPLNFGQYSSKDREVLEKPAKLHYKFVADKEIHPDIVNLVTSKIPEDHVYRFVKRYYTGVIH